MDTIGRLSSESSWPKGVSYTLSGLNLSSPPKNALVRFRIVLVAGLGTTHEPESRLLLPT